MPSRRLLPRSSSSPSAASSPPPTGRTVRARPATATPTSRPALPTGKWLADQPGLDGQRRRRRQLSARRRRPRLHPRPRRRPGHRPLPGRRDRQGGLVRPVQGPASTAGSTWATRACTPARRPPRSSTRTPARSTPSARTATCTAGTRPPAASRSGTVNLYDDYGPKRRPKLTRARSATTGTRPARSFTATGCWSRSVAEGHAGRLRQEDRQGSVGSELADEAGHTGRAGPDDRRGRPVRGRPDPAEPGRHPAGRRPRGQDGGHLHVGDGLRQQRRLPGGAGTLRAGHVDVQPERDLQAEGHARAGRRRCGRSRTRRRCARR